MTNESLTKERDFFIRWFILLVILGFFVGVFLIRNPDISINNTTISILIILAQLVNIYLVFRLSRFLEHPIWLTTTYCLLTPLPYGSWITMPAVLVGVKFKRKSLQN